MVPARRDRRRSAAHHDFRAAQPRRPRAQAIRLRRSIHRGGLVLSLATLLRQHAAPRVIDYLSLDVEGAEDDVLLQFPFDDYLFRVMSIERPSDMLKKVLTERGYSRLAEPLKASAWGEEMWRATASKILI